MCGLPAERNLQNQVQDIVIMSMFSKKQGGQQQQEQNTTTPAGWQGSQQHHNQQGQQQQEDHLVGGVSGAGLLPPTHLGLQSFYLTKINNHLTIKIVFLF